MAQSDFNNINLSRLITQFDAAHKAITAYAPLYTAALTAYERYIKAFEPLYRSMESFRPAIELAQKIQNQMNLVSQSLLAHINSNRQFYEELNMAAMVAANIHRRINQEFTRYFTANQEQLQKIFAFVQYTSINLDLTKINFDAINDLCVNDDGSIALELTELDIQEVNDAVETATCGSYFDLNEFLNKLVELAKSNSKALVIISFVMSVIVGPYCKDVLEYVYPPESFTVFREKRAERLQQVNQQIANQLTHDEVKSTRVVRVRELNVRSEPNIDSVITGYLYFGSDVKIIKTEGNWVFVQWYGDDGIGIQGWVNSRYLSEIKEPSK